MILILFFIILFMIVFVFHAFNDLFRDGIFAKKFQEVYDLHILVGFYKCILDPFVRFAPDKHENIACGDLYDILRSRLEAVHINAVIQKQRQLDIIDVAARDLLYPVVFGEDRRDDLELAVIICFCRA